MEQRLELSARACTKSSDEVAQITASQHGGYRYTFLVAGMRHKTFVDTVRVVFGAESAAKVAQTAAALS